MLAASIVERRTIVAEDDFSGLLDPSAGGNARARKLSPERRAEIAKRAAEARWDKNIRAAVFTGTLAIGDKRLDCAVLEDGTRVLAQGAVLTALAREKSKSMGRRGDKESAKRAPFLSANNLAEFVDEELEAMLTPVSYRMPGERFVSVGYMADALGGVCNVYILAKGAGKLHASQESAYEAAVLLSGSLARIGITALVDEATGYQEVRARDELQKLLEQYVRPEFHRWTEMFPNEFFAQIYRLYGWDYKEGKSKRPGYVGKIINKYVYEWLPEGVLEELRRVNPKLPSGNRSRKHHQHLTVDTGSAHLDKQITSVITLMQVSEDLDEFRELFSRKFKEPTKKILRVVERDDQMITLFEDDDFA